MATPLLLFLVMLIVQFGVWMHSVHVAETVAAQALAAARAEDASSSDGYAQAQAVLDQIGGSSLQDPGVRVTRNATTVHVEVSGYAQPVVPFLRLRSRGVADGAVERFVPVVRRP